MWLSAPQPTACLHTGLYQSSWSLAASDCKYLSGWAARLLLAAHHRIRRPKEEKKKKNLRLEQESGCWECARLYKHVSFSCTPKHLADRTVYYARDESGQSGPNRFQVPCSLSASVGGFV